MPANDPESRDLELASTYLGEVNASRRSAVATEHTYRPAFKTLVEGLVPTVQAINEPQRRRDLGAPDYEVRLRDLYVGHIEAKDLGVSLQAIEDDARLDEPLTPNGQRFRRYLKNLENVILTNYNEIRWYRHGDRQGEPASFGTRDQTGALSVDPGGFQVAFGLIRSFLDQRMVSAKTAAQLAERMAMYTALVRFAIAEAFRTGRASDALVEIRSLFDSAILADESDEDFADMVAQTISYGLFAARVQQSRLSPMPVLKRAAASQFIPKTNPFLRQLFHRLFSEIDFEDEPYAGFVGNLIDLLNAADMASVMKGFSARSTSEHPIVHFYETFLSKYNPGERDRRGVFYTPASVVSFIVRSVDEMLAAPNLLNVTEGLANSEKTGQRHNVLVLDPACGTGTFLEHVILNIRNRFDGLEGMWRGYVREHLVPRVFGFERLMAPYAIAHLHLSSVLAADDGSGPGVAEDLASGKIGRLGVYLTNTLEEPVDVDQTLSASFIVKEAADAGAVKRTLPVMVIVGNPPYRARSTNPSYRVENFTNRRGLTSSRHLNTWIGDQIEEYKKLLVPGSEGPAVIVGLGERNAQSLHDDYVKFMRFAEWRIEETGRGILGFVTNHGYLSNPTFRAMRQHLMRTFDELYVLDLGGNPRERRDGEIDENLFDIRDAGIAVALFVKRGGAAEAPFGRVFHAERRGTREAKETWLGANSYSTIAWSELAPKAPSWLFVPDDASLRAEYDTYPSVLDIFTLRGPGMKTNRDTLTMQFADDEAWQSGQDFLNLSLNEARARWGFEDDSKGWTYERAKRDLGRAVDAAGVHGPTRLPVKVTYRPFDIRHMLWTGTTQGFNGWPSADVMLHYLQVDDAGDRVYENIGFVTARQNATRRSDQFFVTRFPTEMKTGDSSRGSLTMPLYRYPEEAHGQGGLFAEKKSTIASEYVARLRDRTGLSDLPTGRGDLIATFGPEDVLAYVYGVVYSPEYRKRYEEFLRLDFARVPYPVNREGFVRVVRLGHDLVDLHLGRRRGVGLGTVTFPIAGSNRVEKLTTRTKPPRYLAPGEAIGDAGEVSTGRVYLQQAGAVTSAANGPQYFGGIPEDVWEYRIGGHLVLQKWLAARIGRTLSTDEISHFRETVAVIAETITLQARL